jgi:hypothetical protein
MRSVRALVLAAGVLAIIAAAGVVAPPTAAAAPAQTQCGNTAANPTLSVDRSTLGSTETAVVTVTGTGYLLPPHVCGTDVFGGIYLFFGWVQPGGQWGPSFKSSTSTQGLFGTSYSYPGEGGGAETRDDGTGTIRLISFTAGGESGTSTPFHMDGAGNWQSNLTIRGATYSYTDLRTGASNTVDCRVVQCGVYTVGAHGKASRTNERFTPIAFVDSAGAPAAPAAAAGAAPSGAAAGAGASAAGPTGAGAAANGAETSGQDPAGSVPTDTAAAAAEGASSSTSTTEPGESEDDTAMPAAEEAAAVQDFGGDEGSGLPVPLVLAVVVALAVTAVALGMARRRRSGASVTSDGVAP